MIARRIGIVGLGLIGGSLALSLKGKPGAPEVWGCDRRRDTARMAEETGAIARACTEPGIASCDVVVVCVPVIRSIGLIRRLGKRMRPGSVLTDVGSANAEIVRAGQGGMARGAEVVGGHPIPGTANPAHARGVECATPSRGTGTGPPRLIGIFRPPRSGARRRTPRRAPCSPARPGRSPP